MNDTPRRTIVTGSGAGIGLATVEALAGRGDVVWGCDLDPSALEGLRDAGLNVHARRCDIADRTAARAFVDEAMAQMGGLDVLVDNVGVGGPTAPIQDISEAEWKQVMSVNLDGTFWVTQAATGALMESDRGAIVVMSSIAGKYGYPNRLPYATSKWGLIGFAKTLALELGEHGVTANAVLPAAVAGDRLDSVMAGRAEASGRSIESEWDAVYQNLSIRRLVSAHEVAEMVAYLTGDAARSITGQAMSIDVGSKHA